MNLTHARNLVAYNGWAWERVFASLRQLSQADFTAERSYFWGSLYDLTLHCLAAEWIWLQRIHGTNPTSLQEIGTFTGVASIQERLQQEGRRWGAYVDQLSADSLADPVTYKNTQGEAYELTLGDIIHHVFNHATEHRGHMTPTLAQLGVPTEALDYMLFRLQGS
jgi:uncharacterized damage-inducible protein DinB